MITTIRSASSALRQLGSMPLDPPLYFAADSSVGSARWIQNVAESHIICGIARLVLTFVVRCIVMTENTKTRNANRPFVFESSGVLFYFKTRPYDFQKQGTKNDV